MICSNKENLQNHLAKLRQKFIEVHYPENIIQEQFLRLESVNRMDLILKPRANKKKKKKIIPHVSTYNSKNPPYKKWFKELQYILKLNPKTAKISEKVMFWGCSEPPSPAYWVIFLKTSPYSNFIFLIIFFNWVLKIVFNFMLATYL